MYFASNPLTLNMHSFTGPDDPLFKRFKEWFISHHNEARITHTRFPDPALFRKWQWEVSETGPFQEDTDWWARTTLTWVRCRLLQDTFPRNDYRELCELINIVLGGEVGISTYGISILFICRNCFFKYFVHFPQQPIRVRQGQIFEHFEIMKPGAYHHARFMGKSIYLLKMFLLSNIFPLTPEEYQRITQLTGFVVHLYGRHFLSGALGTAAPRLDRGFLYDLQRYRVYAPVIADAAQMSAKRHLWYLTPQLVVLALFDDDLQDDEKQQMAHTLTQIQRPDVINPGKPDFEPVAAKLGPEMPELSSFITAKSWLLFNLLHSRCAWLNHHPSVWHQDPEFTFLRSFCQDLQVVNDSAERAVKDVQDFAEVTRDPAHRDDIILVANDHRGRVAHLRKAALNNV